MLAHREIMPSLNNRLSVRITERKQRRLWRGPNLGLFGYERLAVAAKPESAALALLMRSMPLQYPIESSGLHATGAQR